MRTKGRLLEARTLVVGLIIAVTGVEAKTWSSSALAFAASKGGGGGATAGSSGGGILPRDALLKRAEYEGVDRTLAARVVEAAEESLRTWEVGGTDFFMTPPEYIRMSRVLSGLEDLTFASWGGYEEAERRRMFFARPEVGLDGLAVMVPAGNSALEDERGGGSSSIVALDVGGQFLFDMADHRDYLGSILGTGLTRDKIGDILVQGERGAQVLVHPGVADYLCANMESVRTVKVRVERIPLEELKILPPKVKEVTSVEASTRLDAVGSAGMGMSRSKFGESVKSGLVFINWEPVSSVSATVKDGDVITVRGKGRVEIREIAVTKKDRYRIVMTRFT